MISSDKYPGVKFGFSTQNFLAAMPVEVANIKEILDFASEKGFSFIELRDPAAGLSVPDCRMLAEYAAERDIEVIYEIHKDLFAPDFRTVFGRAVENTAVFGEPGMLRSILSFSEFAADETKRGWTGEELDFITKQADSCAIAAEKTGVRFILENIIEPWFGKGDDRGLDDFFTGSSHVGLQFDTANPFLSACRGTADPDSVVKYLASIADRWYTTHLKCGADDRFQPVLTDNPLPYETILELMESHGVNYAALELSGVETKEACFANHMESIRYLRQKGIINA